MTVLSLAAGALTLDLGAEAATLTLNRPARRNAIGAAMWGALPAAVAAVERERAVKVLVVRGAGGHFSAGADIGEFEQVYATREHAAAYARAVTAGVEALAACAKPVIAAIRGACVGGGVAIALACDLRIAAEDARLGVTPARLGLMYSLTDTRRLVAAVGGSAARDLLFTGRIVDAAEALRLRLVDAVVPPSELDETVAAKAQAMGRASQWTVRRLKRVVRLIEGGTTDDTDETRGWFLDAVEGEDFREGRDAFTAKRPPDFPFR